MLTVYPDYGYNDGEVLEHYEVIEFLTERLRAVECVLKAEVAHNAYNLASEAAKGLVEINLVWEEDDVASSRLAGSNTN